MESSLASVSLPLGHTKTETKKLVRKTPNPIDVHVGSRVRLRRMLVGMSQEKLGEMLGLTFQQIQKYEKGANRIGASRLYQIAQILGVPVQFFYDDMADEIKSGRTGGFSEVDSTPFVMDFVSSSEGLQLNRAFSNIEEPRIRKKLLDLVRALGDD